MVLLIHQYQGINCGGADASGTGGCGVTGACVFYGGTRFGTGCVRVCGIKNTEEKGQQETKRN